MVSNEGLHIFSVAFYNKIFENCPIWCFRGSKGSALKDLSYLVNISYFIHSCKDEILYNIKTYKMRHNLRFAKMRIYRAVNNYS